MPKVFKATSKAVDVGVKTFKATEKAKGSGAVIVDAKAQQAEQASRVSSALYGIKNGKLVSDMNTTAKKLGYKDADNFEKYAKEKPELFYAMGGVKYDDEVIAPINKEGSEFAQMQDRAVNIIISRFKNADINKIQEIIAILNTGEWQDAETIKKYSDTVNTYVNDYIALDTMGYFNSMPEDDRKASIELLNSMKGYVNEIKDVYSNFKTAKQYNEAVLNQKYGKLTWKEIKNAEKDIEDPEELEYVKNLTKGWNEFTWDYLVKFNNASDIEKADMVGEVFYDKESYDEWTDYIKTRTDMIEKSSEIPEHIKQRELNGEDYLLYGRPNDDGTREMGYYAVRDVYADKYGGKNNLYFLNEVLTEQYNKDVDNQVNLEQYEQIKEDPKASEYIAKGKEEYAGDKFINDTEYEIACYFLGKGEDWNYGYLEWLSERIAMREYASSNGWSATNDRQAVKFHKAWSEYTKDNPVTSDVMSIALNLAGGLEWAYNAISGNEGAESILSKAATTIRGTRTSQIDLEIAGWDAFDFIYNTSMSVADSAVAMSIFGGNAGHVLGLSAAAQGTNDAIIRGMDSEQAFWNGLISGTFECFFESVSISQLKQMKQSGGAGFKNIAKNIGKGMLTNATEETLTEIANIAYDIAFNGDLSNYALMIQQYINEGLSEKEAKQKAALALGGQVAESMASGLLMGFGFGGYSSTVSSVNTANYAKMIYGSSWTSVKALVQNGLAMPENSMAYNLAQKAQEQLNSGKKLSGASLYNLSSAIQSEIETQSTARLTELGETKKDISAVSAVVAKKVFNGKITGVETDILNNSRYGRQVVSELSQDPVNTIWQDAVINNYIKSTNGNISEQTQENSIKDNDIYTSKNTQEINPKEFVKGLWDKGKNSVNSDSAENVEKNNLKSIENVDESDIIEETKVLTLDNLTKDVLKTKPPYSPNPKRWIKNEGSVAIDKNGNWIYTDCDGITVKYIDGYPDFESAGAVYQKVNIGSFRNRTTDARRADRLAPNGPRKKDSVWHHSPDGQTMMEISEKIHRKFTHRGGYALMKLKRRK